MKARERQYRHTHSKLFKTKENNTERFRSLTAPKQSHVCQKQTVAHLSQSFLNTETLKQRRNHKKYQLIAEDGNHLLVRSDLMSG